LTQSGTLQEGRGPRPLSRPPVRGPGPAQSRQPVAGQSPHHQSGRTGRPRVLPRGRGPRLRACACPPGGGVGGMRERYRKQSIKVWN